MARHPFGILITALISAILAAAVYGQAKEPAYRWQIVANGAEGTLELSSESGGRISGTLLGSPVEGRLVGRRLVLVREGAGGRESWEAWLATPENVHGDGQPILAGTFLRPGEGGLLPWFGTARPLDAENVVPLPAPVALGATKLDPMPEPSQGVVSGPLTVPPSTTTKSPTQRPTPKATPSLQASTSPPYLPSGQPSLGGTWETPDGPLKIRQEGSSLVFVLPDREVSGRLTGPDSLIGGFGPGCCKGQVEQAFNVIAWDNGVRWVRK